MNWNTRSKDSAKNDHVPAEDSLQRRSSGQTKAFAEELPRPWAYGVVGTADGGTEGGKRLLTYRLKYPGMRGDRIMKCSIYVFRVMSSKPIAEAFSARSKASLTASLRIISLRCDSIVLTGHCRMCAISSLALR